MVTGFPHVTAGKAKKKALVAGACSRDNDRLFMNSRDPRKPLTATAVAVWFHDLYGRRMGWEGYSSHSGRRTVATELARKVASVGGSLRDVQLALGHASLQTTQVYFEGSSDAQRKMMELL